MWAKAVLGRRRQNVAHGVVATIPDVRAVDGSEVTVRLGRRQQAAGAAVLALADFLAASRYRSGAGCVAPKWSPRET